MVASIFSLYHAGNWATRLGALSESLSNEALLTKLEIFVAAGLMAMTTKSTQKR